MKNNAKQKYMSKKVKNRQLITKTIEKSEHCWKIPFVFHGFITEDEINEKISQLVQRYRSERNEKQPIVDPVWYEGKDGKMHFTLKIIKIY